MGIFYDNIVRLANHPEPECEGGALLKKITILLLMTLVITLPVHEFSHVLVAKEFGVNASYVKFGYKIPFFPEIYAHKEINGMSIYMNPIFIGGAADVGYNKTKNLVLYQRILIPAAGPVSNIFLGIVFLFIAEILCGKKYLRAAWKSIYCIIPIINGLIVGKNTGSTCVVSDVVKNMNKNGIFHITKPEGMKDSVFALSTIAMLSIIMGVLNLFPIMSSDGFWIIDTAVEQICDINTARNVVRIMSWAILPAFVWILVKITTKRKN